MKDGDDDWDTPPEFHTCEMTPMSDCIVKWDVSTRQNIIAPECSHIMATTMDGSSYRADLHTRGDFYCPMHSDLKPALKNRSAI